MSVQRYSLSNRELLVTVPDDTGALVLYDDHVAALAEAVEQARIEGHRGWYNQPGMWHEGYEAGKVATPRTLTADARARIAQALRDNGFDSEGGPHSWRCFDKERYPEPCDCMDEVLDDIAAALIHDGEQA